MKSQVIIVGAGVSGLTCGHHLIKNGITNVLILEGDDRWGGRVRTERFGDSLIELGANWIHGGSLANPAFQLANRSPKNLLHEGKIHRLTRKTGFFYLPGGKCVEKELGEKVFDKFFALERKMAEMFGCQDATKRPALDTLEYVKEEFAKIASEFEASERQEVEAILWGLVNYLRFHFGDDLELCDVNLYGSFWDIPGGDVKIPGGYQNIFKVFYEKLKHKIQFEKEVVEIKHEPKKDAILVKCRDGSEYQGQRVIMTASLGYLKRNHESLFEPSLPESKIRAIENLGFGRSGKVFLEFEEPFWAEGEEGLKIAWGKERITSPELPGDWYHSILGFDEVINNRNVLVAWIGGRGAEIMETLPNDEIKETLTNVLRDCTGNPGLDGPIRVMKSTWIQNPLYCGSYSFGSTTSDIPRMPQDLASPVLLGDKSCLQFAGEATHQYGYSTVHGAMWSGLREAERIINA